MESTGTSASGQPKIRIAEYEAVKRDLASRRQPGPQAYTDAKGPIV